MYCFISFEQSSVNGISRVFLPLPCSFIRVGRPNLTSPTITSQMRNGTNSYKVLPFRSIFLNESTAKVWRRQWGEIPLLNLLPSGNAIPALFNVIPNQRLAQICGKRLWLRLSKKYVVSTKSHQM